MSPAVQRLLEFIEQQNAMIRQQALQIQQLKDEIARLKKSTPRPKIKPSSLGKEKSKPSPSSDKKRPGSKKRFKTAQIIIPQTKPIEPEIIPQGAVFRYYKDFVVQDITNEAHNTRYRLKVYETNLLNIALDIQEAILFRPCTVSGRGRIREKDIRPIAAILD